MIQQLEFQFVRKIHFGAYLVKETLDLNLIIDPFGIKSILLK